MATKSLIIRPNADNMGSFSVYSTQDDSLFYLMVNETVADDDATYLYHSKGVGKLYDLDLTADISSISNIQSINLVIRAKTDNSQTNRIVLLITQIADADNGIEATDFFRETLSFQNSSLWETFSVVISDESIIEQIKASPSPYLSLGATLDGASSKDSTAATYLTQLYVEIIYDDGTVETTPFYEKVNGEWTVISGTPYRKENGVWAAIEASDIPEADYKVITLT